MARKKKPVTRSSGKTARLDAFIDKEKAGPNGCPLCLPKVKAELKRVEERLRERGERISIAGLARWLEGEKVLTIANRRLADKMKKPCHIEFYRYLRGLK